jgi:hypothetical protein
VTLQPNAGHGLLILDVSRSRPALFLVVVLLYVFFCVVLCIFVFLYCLFCDVSCIVYVYMFTGQLPPGGYPISVKYISYHIIFTNVAAAKWIEWK